MNPYKTTDVATVAEADGLADIVRRRTWVWGWLLAGLPIVYGAGRLLGEQAVVVTIVWAAVLFGLIIRHVFARCPRCHEFFNWSQRRRHHFAENCTHCGLALQRARSTDDHSASVGTRREQMGRTGSWNSTIVSVLLWLIILGIVYAAWAWLGSVG